MLTTGGHGGRGLRNLPHTPRRIQRDPARRIKGDASRACKTMGALLALFSTWAEDQRPGRKELLMNRLARSTVSDARSASAMHERKFPEGSGVMAGMPELTQLLVSRGRQAFCAFRGHDMILHFEPNRLSLQCWACGAQTPGWRLDPRPRPESHRPRVVARGMGRPEQAGVRSFRDRPELDASSPKVA